MKNQLKVISETYLTSYVIDGKLGKGGQGVTFLLKKKTDFVRLSVLKILNFDRPKTRKRFHIERTALETLNSENLNIPTLLESNSDEYNNQEIPLYIRLSYIKGNTLDDFINTNGTLSLIEAVGKYPSVASSPFEHRPKCWTVFLTLNLEYQGPQPQFSH